jgi:hypothetical protein
MASLFTTISKFARSKQGRDLADKAVRAAKDPKTRRQIDSARRKLMGGGRNPPPAH